MKGINKLNEDYDVKVAYPLAFDIEEDLYLLVTRILIRSSLDVKTFNNLLFIKGLYFQVRRQTFAPLKQQLYDSDNKPLKAHKRKYTARYIACGVWPKETACKRINEQEILMHKPLEGIPG